MAWTSALAAAAAVAAAHAGAAPPPPRCVARDLALRPGPLRVEKTGQHTGTIAIRNRGRRACSLYGYPRLSFLDAHERVLRFRFSHRGDQEIAPQRPRLVVLAPGARAAFDFNKYRCDIRSTAVARYLRVSLPGGRGSRLVHLAADPLIDYCPAEAPSTSIAVSPFHLL